MFTRKGYYFLIIFLFKIISNREREGGKGEAFTMVIDILFFVSMIDQ